MSKYVDGLAGLKAKQSQEEMSKKWDEDGIPIEDTNMAGVGGEEDKAARKAAAGTEEAWQGIGQEEGVWVFRIEQFQVKPWPKEKYGKFHEGDSYIVLQTEFEIEETGEKSDKLAHDIHFWLGKKTSTDERGTAAYKTVELDDFFDGAAIQHREVQGHESEAFLSYFPDGLVYLPGGVESGFKVTQKDVFETDIIQVRREKRRNIFEEEQVQFSTLNHRDAFILSVGREIFVWFGENCSSFVKSAANLRAESMESQSQGEYYVVQYESANDTQVQTFWRALGLKDDEIPPPSDKITAADAVGEEVAADFGEGILYNVQVGEDRTLTVTEVGRGDLKLEMLDSTGVMMVDTRSDIFLWLGKDSSKLEKSSAFGTATNYLKMNSRNPNTTAIHIIKEGSEKRNKAWMKMFSA